MDFENILIRYYGPMGTNQLDAERVFSYSFSQLTDILDQRTEPLTRTAKITCAVLNGWCSTFSMKTPLCLKAGH
jgi:hypothetical protein